MCEVLGKQAEGGTELEFAMNFGGGECNGSGIEELESVLGLVDGEEEGRLFEGIFAGLWRGHAMSGESEVTWSGAEEVVVGGGEGTELLNGSESGD